MPATKMLRLQTRRNRRFRFAMLGFAVTAVFVVYQLVTDSTAASRDFPVMFAFVVLCPPSLISVPLANIAVGTNAFYLLWSLIASLNAALYAIVQGFVERRMRKPD